MGLESFGIKAGTKGRPGSRGFVGSNHAYVQFDANGDPKIIVNSISSNDEWSPVPQEFRAEGYHDPRKPGSKKVINGNLHIWEADKGFVDTGRPAEPLAQFEPGTQKLVKEGYIRSSGLYAKADPSAPQGYRKVAGPDEEMSDVDARNELLTAALNFAKVTGA